MRPMGALANAPLISPIGLIGLIGLISLAPSLNSQLLKHDSYSHLHTPAREEVVA